jgi:hypothetical protein
MARPKSKGAYVPLAAQYFMDDAILEAGPDAELLFVRCLSFLASVSSDGFVTDRQMQTIVGLRLRNVPKRVSSLQEVGLLEAVEGGFMVRSWTKWNKSAEEIGKLLARDRERKARNDAENATNSVWNPTGIRLDSELQSSTEQNSTEQNSKEKGTVHAARSRQLANDFDEWWAIYPKKQGKEAARKKYLTIRKTVEAETLLAGVRQYALLKAGEDKQFVKMPAGWLGDGRWLDEHDSSSAGSASAPKPRLLFCPTHDGYPLPCERCARDAEIPEGNDF